MGVRRRIIRPLGVCRRRIRPLVRIRRLRRGRPIIVRRTVWLGVCRRRIRPLRFGWPVRLIWLRIVGPLVIRRPVRRGIAGLLICLHRTIRILRWPGAICRVLRRRCHRPSWWGDSHRRFRLFRLHLPNLRGRNRTATVLLYGRLLALKLHRWRGRSSFCHHRARFKSSRRPRGSAPARVLIAAGTVGGRRRERPAAPGAQAMEVEAPDPTAIGVD